jgi:DNA polymerase III subunit alpha
LRIINGQRGKVALFKLDDKTATLEATADEALIQAHKALLKDDELVLAQVLAQPDRFSGGLRLKVQQLWDLGSARCRFGKYLKVAVQGPPPDVAALVRTFPPRRELLEQGEQVRGLPVHLQVWREDAACELQLDDRSLFFPSDEALAAWSRQAPAEIVFD